MNGCPSGIPEDEGSGPDPIGLFLDEDGAFTSIASAVAMLTVLALAFSVAAAVWGMSRAGDVQACADATALSGANAVASYTTAATIVDASILSLGLAGIAITGVGVVGLFVPGAQAVATKTIDAGIRTLRARNEFARSASRGLEAIERSLPVLVAARSMGVASAQSGAATSFRGIAIAVPMTSESDFAAMEGDQVPLDGLEESAASLEQVSSELAAAVERTAEAKHAAWVADCGREGFCMQERASSLAGLAVSENPDYATSASWPPGAGIERARVYYRARIALERPTGSGDEAAADSAARKAFYEYALEVLERASFVETDEGVECAIELLPRNSDEVRRTRLYTDPRWPTSIEAGRRTLHYGLACSGATGAVGSSCSLADVESGGVALCPVCRFDIGDMGKVPAASTSIDNGFEYHLREYALALKEYADCRNEEIEIERRARDEADVAVGSFEEAFGSLAVERPSIAPPGRYGCVGIAAMTAEGSGQAFPFTQRVDVGERFAVSAAALAPEAGARESNVLSEFFSGVAARAGTDGPIGLIDGVMDLWGTLLVSYGDLSASLGEAVDGLFGDMGGGPLAEWLSDGIQGVVEGLGFAPVDLRLKKPVLVNTQEVLAQSGIDGVAAAQGMARSLPAGASDPAAALEALGYAVGDYVLDEEFTLAEVPIPGTSISVPLRIRLRDLVGGSA